MSQILVTGAAGFLGRALVHAARNAGVDVVALCRGVETPDWANDAGIMQIKIDLGDPDAIQALAAPLKDVTAVLHAAASFTGDATAHARDTLAATSHLVTALDRANTGARLILVSSLSVYDVAAMADYAILDETGPLVTSAAQRDVYAAAKAEQEQRARAYVRGPMQILRPGAIYGPHRLWSAQLGFAKAGRAICPGGDAPIPAIHVDRAAAALVRAATMGQGGKVINLVDADPPTQEDWLQALDMPVIRVPRGAALIAGRALGRGPAWQARFRPLRYDTARAEALMAGLPRRTFADAVTEARRIEQNSL